MLELERPGKSARQLERQVKLVPVLDGLVMTVRTGMPV